MQMRIVVGLLLLLSLVAGAGATAPGGWVHTGSFPFDGTESYSTWIAVNTTGFLYATADGGWVQIFRPDGTPSGRLEGGTDHPLWMLRGIAVNATDFVYVSNRSEDAEIVQIFDRNNQRVGALALPSGYFYPGDIAVNATGFVHVFGSLSSPITGLESVLPGGSVLVFDRDGTLVAGYNVDIDNYGRPLTAPPWSAWGTVAALHSTGGCSRSACSTVSPRHSMQRSRRMVRPW